jgi:hypothetical protein
VVGWGMGGGRKGGALIAVNRRCMSRVSARAAVHLADRSGRAHSSAQRWGMRQGPSRRLATLSG